MTRTELEHAIRAACDVSRDDEVYVFGSQAILGQFPDAPDGVRMSQEADISPKNHPERVDLIDGSLGEESQFHRARAARRAIDHAPQTHCAATVVAIVLRGAGTARQLGGHYRARPAHSSLTAPHHRHHHSRRGHDRRGEEARPRRHIK